jgi:DNA uptake protein ComE-like DNA-binding protein
VNVNTGSKEELTWVLDVGDDVADEIMKRRSARPFRSATDLEKVPGVRAQRLTLLGPRLQF